MALPSSSEHVNCEVSLWKSAIGTDQTEIENDIDSVLADTVEHKIVSKSQTSTILDHVKCPFNFIKLQEDAEAYTSWGGITHFLLNSFS